MKRILISLFLILLIFSCKKDDPEPKTTYQVRNNSSHYSSSIQYLDGSIYEVVVFCYVEDDLVRQDNIPKIVYGGEKSEEKEVPKGCTKIKVSFKFLPKESPYYNLESNNRMYISAFTLIEKGKNNICSLENNTMIGGTLQAIRAEIILKNQ